MINGSHKINEAHICHYQNILSPRSLYVHGIAYKKWQMPNIPFNDKHQSISIWSPCLGLTSCTMPSHVSANPNSWPHSLWCISSWAQLLISWHLDNALFHHHQNLAPPPSPHSFLINMVSNILEHFIVLWTICEQIILTFPSILNVL